MFLILRLSSFLQHFVKSFNPKGALPPFGLIERIEVLQKASLFERDKA